MSLARTLLLRASRSPWLAEQFRGRAFARRAVRRFMPGEEPADALRAAADFASRGMGTVVTALGERVHTTAEAERVREHYLGMLDDIAARALPTQVSVKLTHLGLDVNRELCGESVRMLAERAATKGNFLWIDIEESHYVDATLELYRRVRGEYPNVGVCLQAYLHRTPADLESILAMGGTIRLVKGAYREPPEIAHARKRDTDRAYLELGEAMLQAAARGEGAGPQVFGTHDMRILEQLRATAAAHDVPATAWEVHMLYGIRAAEQQALAAAGVGVRILVSYGRQWFPWYVRRLAERPANVWFVVRSLLS